MNDAPVHPIVARMLETDAMSRAMGMEVLESEPGRCVCRLTVRPDMLNGFGIAHGAVTYALADSTLAFAVNAMGRHAVSTAGTGSNSAHAAGGQNTSGFFATVTVNGDAIKNDERHAFHVLAGSINVAGRTNANCADLDIGVSGDAGVKVAAVFFAELDGVANDEGAAAFHVDAVAGFNERRPVAYAYACAWRGEEDCSLLTRQDTI